MFSSLVNKIADVLSSLKGKMKITEENIKDAITEIRQALIEADVDYNVIQNFISSVKDKALESELVKSVSPSQKFISIVYQELVNCLKNENEELNLSNNPSYIMLCGLQGTGKTTFIAKLAGLLKKKLPSKKILVVSCDLRRPAAIEQLQYLCKEQDIPFFLPKDSVLVTAKEVKKFVDNEGYEVIIVDTSGRSHVEENLMEELKELKQVFSPQEILFTVNAALGQEALNSAKEFNNILDFSGIVLTMMDSEAKAGAAFSVKYVLNKPIKFESSGEHLDDIYEFNPESLASRIIGFGDTINFVKKIEDTINEEERNLFEKKILESTFSYDSYLKQIKLFKCMGPFKKLASMMPGAFKISQEKLDESEEEFKKTEAIILSMTPREREEKDDLDIDRMKRIAKGSGTSFGDVNKLKKNLGKAKIFFKEVKNKKNFDDIDQFIGGL